jgi:hypothetical protein
LCKCSCEGTQILFEQGTEEGRSIYGEIEGKRMSGEGNLLSLWVEHVVNKGVVSGGKSGDIEVIENLLNGMNFI